MCGIIGARQEWLARRADAPAEQMAAAVASMAWRGRDGHGVLHIGSWWLGCARLAITQRHSRQPLLARGGRFAAVLNGAITNARELWAQLLPRAERRRTPPNDAWLPLLAIARGKPALLAELRGHHAYAVVDASTDQLWLGQDRYGEKPFYCLQQRNADEHRLLAFASTLPALEALGMPPLGLPLRTRKLLRFGHAAMAPARLPDNLRLSELSQRGAPQQSCRGAVPRAVAIARSSSRTAASATPATGDQLVDQLCASVARCCDSSEPIGLLLSGGIDSSCLAAALRRLRQRCPAFQFRAVGASNRERQVAAAVAAHCELPLVPVDGGPELLEALPVLTQLAGQPLGDPSVLAMHAVAKAAAAEGRRILLSGEGADELFLGYRRYRALQHMPYWPWLRRWLPQWSMHPLARWLRAAASADPAASLSEVSPPGFRRAVLALHPPREPASRAAVDWLELARSRDLTRYLRHDLLLKVDTATLAAGIEGRCPYLEGDCRADGATANGKRPLRNAFANLLPPQVFRQPKRGFSIPLDRWLRGDSILLDLLAEPRSRHRPHLRPGALALAIDRHRRGHCNLGHAIYLLAALEFFLRRYDEKDSATRAEQTTDLGLD